MPGMIEIESFLGRQRKHGAPPFGGSDERRIALSVKNHIEKTGTPKRTSGLIATIGFFLIKNFSPRAAVVGEGRLVSFHHHTQTRDRVAGGYLVLFAGHRKPIGIVSFVIYRLVMSPKMH